MNQQSETSTNGSEDPRTRVLFIIGAVIFIVFFALSFGQTFDFWGVGISDQETYNSNLFLLVGVLAWSILGSLAWALRGAKGVPIACIIALLAVLGLILTSVQFYSKKSNVEKGNKEAIAFLDSIELPSNYQVETNKISLMSTNSESSRDGFVSKEVATSSNNSNIDDDLHKIVIDEGATYIGSKCANGPEDREYLYTLSDTRILIIEIDESLDSDEIIAKIHVRYSLKKDRFSYQISDFRDQKCSELG